MIKTMNVETKIDGYMGKSPDYLGINFRGGKEILRSYLNLTRIRNLSRDQSGENRKKFNYADAFCDLRTLKALMT